MQMTKAQDAILDYLRGQTEPRSTLAVGAACYYECHPREKDSGWAKTKLLERIESEQRSIRFINWASGELLKMQSEGLVEWNTKLQWKIKEK